MAEKLDPQQVVTFEELLRSMMYEQDERITLGKLLIPIEVFIATLCGVAPVALI